MRHAIDTASLLADGAGPGPSSDRAGRRQFVLQGAACGLLTLLPLRAARAQDDNRWREALAALTGGVQPRAGRVVLEIAPLVDNGNTVPVTVSFDSPMTAADHVRRLALLTPRNPQPEVAVFTLGPASGRAQVATRMRLATSQTVLALAQTSDGTWWQTGVEVLVTLAACVEG